MFLLQEYYAYYVVFTGVFLEGETALIAASFLSKTGNLRLSFVIITAFAATLFSDWLWFFIGRTKGQKLISNRKTLQKLKIRIDKIIQQYPLIIILGYRYIYGLRTAIPLIIGASSIKTSRFLIYSLLTIVLWTLLFSMLGYSFGLIIQKGFEKILYYQKLILGAIILAGMITGMAIYYISRRKIID